MNSRNFILITVLALLTLGCSEAVNSKSGFGNPATVSLTLDTHLNGRQLTIQGKTDLPNGALISYEIKHERFVLKHGEKLFADGQATVSGGSYSSSFDLKGWPVGKVEVWVAFQTVLGTDIHQPTEVISRFGEAGERMEGSNVTKAGLLKRVELTKSLSLQPGR